MLSINILLLVASLSLMIANAASQADIPGILVLSPDGSQTYQCGGKIPVRLSTGSDIKSINTISIAVAGQPVTPMTCNPPPNPKALANSQRPTWTYSCEIPSSYCDGRQFVITVNSDNGLSSDIYNGESSTFAIGNPGNNGLVFTNPTLGATYRCDQTIDIQWVDKFNAYTGKTFDLFTLIPFTAQGGLYFPGNIPGTAGVLQISQGHFSFKLNSLVSPLVERRGYLFEFGVDGQVYTSPPFYITGNC